MASVPSFADQVRSGLADCGFSSPQDGLLLAVSGGIDSMVLLHTVAEVLADHLSRVHVAHIDHQLRGEHGRQDAELVRSQGRALGMTVHLRSVDVPTQQQRQGGSLEEVARHLRYQLLVEIAQEQHCGWIACAHHREDQAETVLHHILRGTGVKGLAGMGRCRVLTDQISLIRPLLDVSQEAIHRQAERLQLSWHEDASNQSSDFTRNRIRHQLLPQLAEQFNPRVVESLCRLSDQARDADRLSCDVADRCLQGVLLENQPGVCRLDRQQLAEWPLQVVREVLRQIWNDQTWPQRGMTRGHWDHLARSLVTPEETPPDVPGVSVSVTPTMVRLFGPSGERN